MPSFFKNRSSATLAIITIAVTVASCGGGSSGSVTSTRSLNLTGTAATGAAIISRPVEGKCAAGSGTATSQADGKFSITIDDGKLPCIVRVTNANGTFLHTVTIGSGSETTIGAATVTTATSNITQATELIVASLAGTDLATYFANYSATVAAALTDAKVASAQMAVISTLQAGGVDFASAGNLITGSLTPITATSAGNAYSQALTSLTTTLTTSGTSLAAIASAIAASTTQTASGSASTNPTPSLPADLLLKASATSCSALRSGKYRFVQPAVASSGSYPTSLVTIDAVGLTITGQTGNVFAMTATGNCQFSIVGGSDIVVSQAGVIVGQRQGGLGAILGFPQQSLSVADLAGNWIGMGPELDVPGAYTAPSVSASFSQAGAISNVSYCANVKTCQLESGLILNISPSTTDAGFNIVSTTPGDLYTDRLFAYRAGGGELMLIDVSENGSHKLWTKQRTNVLPIIGTIANNWNVTSNSNLSVSPVISEARNTIVSVNTLNNSWLRNSVINFTTNVTRPENLFLNNPRNGFNLRLGETVTASDSTSSTTSEFINLGLLGMGVTVVAFPTSKQIIYSIPKP